MRNTVKFSFSFLFLSFCLSGLAVLHFAHHSQGPLHCLQLPQCLLQGRPQCLRDGGVLQRPVPAACPALPRPAAGQRQRVRAALLAAGQRAEPQVCAGVQLHAQSLFLRTLPGLSGQPTVVTGILCALIFIHFVALWSSGTSFFFIVLFCTCFLRKCFGHIRYTRITSVVFKCFQHFHNLLALL